MKCTSINNRNGAIKKINPKSTPMRRMIFFAETDIIPNLYKAIDMQIKTIANIKIPNHPHRLNYHIMDCVGANYVRPHNSR